MPGKFYGFESHPGIFFAAENFETRERLEPLTSVFEVSGTGLEGCLIQNKPARTEHRLLHLSISLTKLNKQPSP